MGLFDRLNTRAVTWNRFYGDSSGNKTASGNSVSEVTALKYSVVWAATTLIADAISGLTPEAYRVDPNTGVRSPVPVPRWVAKPSTTFRRKEVYSQLLISALLWGNAYAMLARRDSDGVVVGMVVLDPSTVECDWAENVKESAAPAGQRVYRLNGTGRWYGEGDILHIQGATLPGRPKGLSMVAQARESIALGLTLEEFGARYFSQGSHHKVIIKVPKRALKENESRDLVRQFEQFTRGRGNWHKPSVLSGQDVDIVNITIPPEDAQFLQSKEFQAVDVARWFRVPPHAVGIVSRETSWGSGLAEQNTAMVQRTFKPWIDRLEGVFTAYSPGGEESGQRVQLNISELLRGSFKDMVDAWGAAVTVRLATRNEGRKALGLDPIPGGDTIDPVPQPPQNNQSTNQDNQNQQDQQRFLDLTELLLRHLPGHHNQKDHGHKGVQAAPEYKDLDPKGKAAVDETLSDYGTSVGEMTEHIGSVCKNSDMKEAATWFPEAHKYATQLAEKHNVSTEQATAVLAIMSARTPWPQNQKIADRILGKFREHDGIPASEAASRIGGGLKKNMAPAIDVARDSSVIDQKVTGTKRRSFYNNILAPGETGDVTVDTWMLNIVQGTADRPVSKDEAFDFLSLKKSTTKVGAGYIGVSEAVRNYALKTGQSPDTIQSAYWIAASGAFTGSTKG